MKDSLSESEKEFTELTQDITQVINDLNNPVTVGRILYSIAEERKSTNLIIRDINGKFDILNEKITHLEELTKRLDAVLGHLEAMQEKMSRAPPSTPTPSHSTRDISERDREVLEFVESEDRVSAQDLQEKFNYKGANAASARLSKLFHQGLLDKVYVGRKVYYRPKQ